MYAFLFTSANRISYTISRFSFSISHHSTLHPLLSPSKHYSQRRQQTNQRSTLEGLSPHTALCTCIWRGGSGGSRSGGLGATGNSGAYNTSRNFCGIQGATCCACLGAWGVFATLCKIGGADIVWYGIDVFGGIRRRGPICANTWVICYICLLFTMCYKLSSRKVDLVTRLTRLMWKIQEGRGRTPKHLLSLTKVCPPQRYGQAWFCASWGLR